jgi:hypothetical protein
MYICIIIIRTYIYDYIEYAYHCQVVCASVRDQRSVFWSVAWADVSREDQYSSSVFASQKGSAQSQNR